MAITIKFSNRLRLAVYAEEGAPILIEHKDNVLQVEYMIVLGVIDCNHARTLVPGKFKEGNKITYFGDDAKFLVANL